MDGTTCTLIDAINSANNDTVYGSCSAGDGADTITLSGNVTLTAVNNGYNGLPVISSEITIEGAGFTISRDSGVPEFRLFEVAGSGDLTLNNVTVSGGNTASSSNSGGGILNGGALTVNNSTLSGNSAYRGGGVYNSGALTVNNSTLSGNSASSRGGGIFNYGTAMVNNSTLSGNSAYRGGGVYSNSALTVNNSTISGNSASDMGGGILNVGTATLAGSLISGNTATSGANEIYNYNTVTNNGNNLFGHSGLTNAQAFGGFMPGGNDINATSNGGMTTPPALSEILNTTLADNGGPTFTHALVSGSPAINAAGDSGLATDQRGISRPQGSADDIGAVEALINARINGSDCDLSDAITAANTDAPAGLCVAGTSGADTITLLSDVTLTAVNNSYNGLPVISSEITIEGAGFTISRESNAPGFRIFEVAATGDLTLNNVTVSGGNTASSYNNGGGIYNNGGALTVNTSTLSGNSASGRGGGVFNRGTATVNNSTLSGNSTSSRGGGIFNDNTATVTNSTISGNSASDMGGGIFNAGTATLAGSLISGNTATSGANEIHNYKTVTNNGNNLFGHSGLTNAQAFGGFMPGGNDINATSNGGMTTPPALSEILNPTLADNGGPTFTHALVSGSPAINAAGDSGYATDQRGISRPQGSAHDIGAVEELINARINGSDCDLSDAITAANTDAPAGLCVAGTSGADTITLLSNVTLNAVDNNSKVGPNGLPVISSEITIEGAGFTISRESSAPGFRLFLVYSVGDLTLNNVTVSGGNVASTASSLTFNGGGIHNILGALTVNNSTLSGNSATASGGGIFNNRGAVTVNNSTLSGNSATAGGGGIFNSRGAVTVNNSTLSGNSASDMGGGIFNTRGAVTVNNSTLSSNSAYRGGGIYLDSFSTVTLAGNLISGNTATSVNEIDAVGSITADNFNLFGHSGLTNAQAFDGFTPGGNDINATSDGGMTTPPALSEILNTTLADNGGPTFTHALVTGSPAIDAISTGNGMARAGAAQAATCTANTSYDQRGVLRANGTTTGSACDIGSFEFDAAPTAVTVAAFSAETVWGSGPRLAWETADETGLSGFHIWRGSAEKAETRLTDALIGAAGGLGGQAYVWQDAVSFTWGQRTHYWLEAVRADGSHSFTGPVEVVGIGRLFLPAMMR